jgi:hypothetical protein
MRIPRAAEQFRSHSSDSHGTLILSLATPHGIYLAADSRATNPQRDDAQKLFKIGASAFVGIVATLVGRSEMQSKRRKTMYSGTIDLTEILYHAATTYDDKHDLLSYVAGSIYHPLKRYWEFLQVSGQQVSETLGGWHFCTVPVVCLSQGQFQIFELQFPFADTGLLPPTRRLRQESGIVWGQCPKVDSIDLNPQTPEAANASIQAIYRAAHAAYPDTVGGPTDIGIVDRDGARWLSRKGDVNESPEAS